MQAASRFSRYLGKLRLRLRGPGKIVLGMALVGTAMTLPLLEYVPNLPAGILRIVGYGSVLSVTACWLLFALSMGAGVAFNWSPSSKLLMFLAAALALPAILGAIGLFALGFTPAIPAGARPIFIAAGIYAGVVFVVPAILFLFFTSPGKP